MKKKVKKGMYWHEYHRGLISYCWNYDGRAEAIRAIKPKNEIKKRIRWFQPVKGKLPNAVVRACRDYTEAAAKMLGDIPAAMSATYYKARDAYDKALEDNKTAIEELHRKECKDCTWNGKELVF